MAPEQLSREQLSPDEARRMSLGSLAFDSHGVDDMLQRLRVLQIDSVNVFARSHTMPAFSRLGPYSTAKLDDTIWRSGNYTEYWAHEAAVIPVEDRPLFGWRMHDFRERYRERADHLGPVLDRVRAQLRDGGAQFASELEMDRREARGPWWDWSDTKRAVEMLFAWGEVVSVGREKFQRRYALADDIPDVDRAAAQRTLVEQASRALGVATLADLADYYRMKTAETRVAVRDLSEAGVLVPVSVPGWAPAWRHRSVTDVPVIRRDTLLSPFDPVCWFRPRAERMFDFHYRIEIYTPKEKRQYGYYSLPLMVGGKLAGRIDLKADRANRALLVQSAWQESDAPARTLTAAEKVIARAAAWQGLTEVRVTGEGNLPVRGSAIH